MTNATNTRWITVASLLLLIANIITLTLMWAHHHHEHKEANRDLPSPMRGPVFEFVTRELNLNQQQQDAYTKLREDHQAKQRPLQDSIRKAKDAFFSLLEQPTVSDSQLDLYSKKNIQAEQQLDLVTFKHFQQLRALCSPEQQKKFDRIIREVLHQLQVPGPRPEPPPGREGEGAGMQGPPGSEREEHEMPPPPGKKN